jgi:hypothetical protein
MASEIPRVVDAKNAMGSMCPLSLAKHVICYADKQPYIGNCYVDGSLIMAYRYRSILVGAFAVLSPYASHIIERDPSENMESAAILYLDITYDDKKLHPIKLTFTYDASKPIFS